MDHLDIRGLDVRRSADWEALPSNWCPRNLFPPLDSSILSRNVSPLTNLQPLWRHRFHLVSAIFHVLRKQSRSSYSVDSILVFLKIIGCAWEELIVDKYIAKNRKNRCTIVLCCINYWDFKNYNFYFSDSRVITVW